MRLPKLYAPTKIRFWSLRATFGQDYGVCFDTDVQVERTCRRVLCPGGWKWQIVNYARDVEWDWLMETDKEVLDMNESELEFELV